MSKNKGAYLATGQSMVVGDYLTSKNGMFFAYLQEDGNFCIYRGTPDRNLGSLWCSMKLRRGLIFATMQEDGNFVIYETLPGEQRPYFASDTWREKGEYVLYLQDNSRLAIYKGEPDLLIGDPIWTAGITDEVSFTPEKIEYHLDDLPDPERSELSVYRVSHKPQNVPGAITIHETRKVQETRGWSNSLRVAVTAGVELSVGVPLVGEGKVSLSTTVENTYTWNGSSTLEREWGFSFEITPPLNTSVVAEVVVTMGKITVPYTMTGVFTYKSGKKYRGAVTGNYTGTNSYDLQVSTTALSGEAVPQTTHRIVSAEHR
jgi:hypothetical protein